VIRLEYATPLRRKPRKRWHPIRWIVSHWYITIPVVLLILELYWLSGSVIRAGVGA
jgi:hypothetical protein